MLETVRTDYAFPVFLSCATTVVEEILDRPKVIQLNIQTSKHDVEIYLQSGGQPSASGFAQLFSRNA